MPNRGFYLLYRHVRGKVLIALADGTVAIFRRKPGIVSSRVYFEALNFILVFPITWCTKILPNSLDIFCINISNETLTRLIS